jgi:outer membrane lipoprotein-sorting protein
MVASILPAAVAADDVDAVVKRIGQAWQKHRSMTANLKIERGLGPDAESKEEGTGTLEMMRREGKLCYRVELQSTAHVKIGEREGVMTQKVTTICDGDVVYSTTQIGEQLRTERIPVDPSMAGDPIALLNDMRTEHKLSLLPDSKIGDRKVWVIEAALGYKPSIPVAPTRSLMSFDQASGCLLEMAVHNQEGKLIAKMSYSDHKFDVKLDPKRFKYEPPQDPEADDGTRGG